MVYILVLFGSIALLVACLGVQVLLRHRALRKFVRSVRQRTDSASERALTEETPLQRPRRNPRTLAIELQEIRALSRRAEVALARGHHDEAERFYIQALTVRPNEPEVQSALAAIYMETGREAKAEALYREVLQHCDDAEHHGNLGLALYNQDKFAPACAELQAALERDDTNAERMYALGKAHRANHQYEEAAALLEKASVRLSRDTELLRMLAECYMHLGLRQQAQETFKRINRLEPYDEEVKEQLVSLASA